jgi:VWFA-related protein
MSASLETILIRGRLSRVLLPLFLGATICAHSLAFGQSGPGSSDPGSSDSGSEDSVNFSYRSTVSEVRLVFFAADENNHTVEDLQKDDFAVVDDERVIRDFSSFTRSALTKLDVVVLIDSSDSVLPHFRQEIADVLRLISQSPWSPEDNVSVLSFSGTEVRSICSGDCRRSFTTDEVASLPSGGATPLFDAVEVATNSLIERRQPEVWPVIILFSDGDDTISKSSFHEASERIVDNGVQVYAVDVSIPGGPSNGRAMLQRIANDSGGRCFRIGEGALGIFSDVIDDLHSARVVTYVPPVSGSDFHSIRILPTHNLNLQFRCRRGYYRRSSSAH